MHYDLVIITSEKLEDQLLDKFNYLILDNNHFLINEYQTNNNIQFDYVIATNKNALKNMKLILNDDLQIITNYFFQTSEEHIFLIGDNQSPKTLSAQFHHVLDFLVN